jgi:hypothetical protein
MLLGGILLSLWLLFLQLAVPPRRVLDATGTTPPWCAGDEEIHLSWLLLVLGAKAGREKLQGGSEEYGAAAAGDAEMDDEVDAEEEQHEQQGPACKPAPMAATITTSVLLICC